MEWKGRRGSRNIEDRRGMSVGRAGGIGGIGAVVILLVGLFLGVDVTPLLNNQGGTVTASSAEITPADRERAEFVSVVLADNEEIWTRLFREQLSRQYTPATLVLFKGSTASPCGGASGATGPFYCPGDRKVYLDTDFFTTMDRELGASGDFAAAYVVAHDVAHHVQNELGILGQVNRLRAQSGQAESNALSVRIELMADCLSGIWARSAARQFGTIDRADFEEALNAARQIGDDTLQRNAGRRPMPHTFTHGTSDQREGWFLRGLASGNIADCDTLSAQTL
jgi:predicted metalloprotease